MFMTRKEIFGLSLLALVCILSFLTGFDYFVARTISDRTSMGISLFFSYGYYIVFGVLSLIVLFFKSRRAAATVIVSVIALSLMHTFFTEYTPRERPPEAMPIGDELMNTIMNFKGSSSFFSGHTATVVSVYTVFSLINYHSTLILFLISTIIISRITLVHHYVSDVIAGIIFGYVVTKVIYTIIQKYNCQNARSK